MKLICPKCKDEEIADDDLRKLISPYDLYKQPAMMREIVEKCFLKVPCPNCAGKLMLIEGVYTTFRDGTKFSPIGKIKALKMLKELTNKTKKKYGKEFKEAKKEMKRYKEQFKALEKK